MWWLSTCKSHQIPPKACYFHITIRKIWGEARYTFPVGRGHPSFHLPWHVQRLVPSDCHRETWLLSWTTLNTGSVHVDCSMSIDCSCIVCCFKISCHLENIKLSYHWHIDQHVYGILCYRCVIVIFNFAKFCTSLFLPLLVADCLKCFYNVYWASTQYKILLRSFHMLP